MSSGAAEAIFSATEDMAPVATQDMSRTCLLFQEEQISSVAALDMSSGPIRINGVGFCLKRYYMFTHCYIC